jgi:hypothetical protein
MFGIGKKIQREKRDFFNLLLIKINKFFPILYNYLNLKIEKNKFKKTLNKKLIRLKQSKSSEKINSYEFKITSQNGEDGIIDYIFSKIEHNKIFFEVGFEYEECNSLNLIKNEWSGYLVDANKVKCETMLKFLEYSLMNKDIQIMNEFVNIKNLNSMINDINIDFFSLDIDGNDYWVMNSLNLERVKVICCEYNPFFGNKEAITIPYDEKFEYKFDHYFGASLTAFTKLFKDKNFELIAVDSSGTNAFFINKKYAHQFEILSPKLSYKTSVYFAEKDFLNIRSKVMSKKLIYI